MPVVLCSCAITSQQYTLSLDALKTTFKGLYNSFAGQIAALLSAVGHLEDLSVVLRR